MKQFITLATFTYPHEITILKHLLLEAGLQFYFENETMLSVAPFYTFALGGIKLKVHNEDADKAKEVLEDFNHSNHLKIV